jgi:hypothetical protein
MATTINGSAGVVTNSGAVYDSIQRGTAVTASGTSVDFTSIPSWVKRITVMFSGVSGNGTSPFLIQIGSGSFTTTGYSSNATSSGATTLSTAGFAITQYSIAANLNNGHIVITNISTNNWVESGIIGASAPNTLSSSCGSVSLSGTLDRIRITTANGTDTFDAGSINILYE